MGWYCGSVVDEALRAPAGLQEGGLFEAAHSLSPTLPQYHPTQLLELMDLGKVRRAKVRPPRPAQTHGAGEEGQGSAITMVLLTLESISRLLFLGDLCLSRWGRGVLPRDAYRLTDYIRNQNQNISYAH